MSWKASGGSAVQARASRAVVVPPPSTAPAASRIRSGASTPPRNRAEALAELIRMGRGKLGPLPPELLAQHVLEIYPSAEWPLLHAACGALLRRWEFSVRDGLRIASAPSRGAFGRWRTRANRGPARPYDTVLWSVEPLQGCCDCPDFRRGSLGVCKHLLVVLAHLSKKKGRWKRLLASTPTRRPLLLWDSVRPLLGAADWLERVYAESRPAGELSRALRRVLVRTADGRWRPKSVSADRPRDRLALVRALWSATRSETQDGRASPSIDTALAARLVEEQADLEQVVALERARPRLERAQRGLRRRLFPYQVAGVERFLARGRLLLADDMGLGKTTQAVAACHALWGAGLARRGLLLVPAPLKAQWLAEWSATSTAPCTQVEGQGPDRAHLYRKTRAGFLVSNYEQALRDIEAILAWNPDLVVLDEAQRIKNWEAKTAHTVKRLRPPYRLVLTGTPMENRLEELASIYDWVDDHALEPKWRLAPLHTLPVAEVPPPARDPESGARAARPYAPGGVRHLDTLRQRIAPTLLRRTRAEVLGDLPRRTDTRVPIQLTAAQLEAHAELDRPIAQLVQRAAARPLTRAEFLRLMMLLDTQRRIANGLALHDFSRVWPEIAERRPTERLIETLDAPKLLELREIARALVLDQGRKVVVFSQWRRMLHLAHWALSDLLADHGLSAAFFTGGQSARRRTQSLVDFHDEPAVRLLFLTDAGGVGLNLQRAASACLLLELPWNPAVLEQRVGRIHRLGQREPIQVFTLVAQGCIEERIAAIVADKRALFRGLFDGTSDAIAFERSNRFVDSLQDLAPPSPAPAPTAGAEQPAASATSPEEIDGEDEEDLEVEAVIDGAESASSDVLPAMPERDPFRELAIERQSDGSLRIHAPPAAAAALASAFETLARLMRDAAHR